MKFFLAIFAFLAVANAQESCDLCKMGVDALGQYLMTGKTIQPETKPLIFHQTINTWNYLFAEGEIAAVEEGLVDLVCSTLDEEDIQTCAEGKAYSRVC